jgi:hypothetical protein
MLELLASYQSRISDLERVSIHAAPIVHRPLPKEPLTHFSADLVTARFKAHVHVPQIAASIAAGHVSLHVTNVCFAECLALACFELRHGFVASWPGFAVLFHKLFGVGVVPWLPSLFLAVLGQPAMPRLQFDLEEVLRFVEALKSH